MPTVRELARLYREAHNIMRNIDGLQPQEAFDELLKYLFFKQHCETLKDEKKITSPEKVRDFFSSYLGRTNSWSSEIWREKEIYLTKECLSDIHDLLFPISFGEISYDVRSHALREFLTPEIRKGLGIFLTPDEVVSAIVDFLSPFNGGKVLDPACGSGTFLIEYLKNNKSQESTTVFGIDKSPRMLLLADLNIGHYSNVIFEKKLADSIKYEGFDNSFDFVLTNPPFGMAVDGRDYDFSKLKTCKDINGYVLKKQSSEIVFIERCFQSLKPGGTLAIVIPKSIATNSSLSVARKALGSYGYIFGIMNLPPETFSSTGTQTTTVVLFAKKYIDNNEPKDPVKLALASIKNVGFDSTGRFRNGNQLPTFSDNMKIALSANKDSEYVSLVDVESKSKSFEILEDIFISKNNLRGRRLSELCEFIGTGKTPARKDYCENGNFLVKVGNLSGFGIKWEARDRNYITNDELDKRKNAKKPLILKKGDILLTSSAHSPVYIAKKSDIFTGVPEFVGCQDVSFVGEVMLVRVDQELISPFLLLAFLRSKDVVENIQNMVRGQTAHLHASDLGKVLVPDEVFNTESKYNKAAAILERQALLSEEMNFLVSEQVRILN